MDIATVIGLALGFALMLLGVVSGGLALTDLIDIPSVMITFGGAAAATIISFPWTSTIGVGAVTKKAFQNPPSDLPGLITTLVSFSEKARREGLLALEDDINELPEEFLKKGIQLVVDGTDPELVRNIMETEIGNTATRHAYGRAWWDAYAGFAPGFGMLGTLVGLVGMLKNLGGGDASAIGQGMATALITTLYGSLAQNLFAAPIVRKLTRRSEDELVIKQVMVEGTLSIQSGDNPRIVKEKLASFLTPAERTALKDDGD
ncbi:MotA/TolQ/ExbB proton channel family protein [Leptospira sp. 201903075]|uniref:motility protein A n=1 Tax=Leptospira chreensis TaxID=2810035 RepID=UPI00196318D6|nr:MotA/TolQ/ExbB proton channel family protein [Leptospira chreensis]MBM9590212.1 MotA/TolQ/ExbB proton channel family protein [Leptospira chreensis]